MTNEETPLPLPQEMYPKIGISTYHGERTSLFYVTVQHSADPSDWSLIGCKTSRDDALQLVKLALENPTLKLVK